MSRELVIHRHYCKWLLKFIANYLLHSSVQSAHQNFSLSEVLSLSLHNWLRKNTIIGSLFLRSRFEWCVIQVPWSDSLYHCCTPGTQISITSSPHCVSAQLRLPSKTDPWSHCEVCSLPVCSSWQVHSHDNTVHTQLTS